MYESMKFIDDYLKGKYRKEVVKNTNNCGFAYYKKFNNKPFAYSFVKSIGFNFFLREVYKINEW